MTLLRCHLLKFNKQPLYCGGLLTTKTARIYGMAHYSPTAPAVVAARGNEPAPAVDEEGRVVAGFETVWVPVLTTAVADAEEDASERWRATLCSTS